MTFVPGKVDIDRLLDGYSLRVVMYPDESLGFYSEPCIESFQLPNVLVNGGAVWGKTDCVHAVDEAPLTADLDWDRSLPGSYAYNNFADIVVSSSPLSGLFRVYKASKYKEIRFVTASDFRLVWDSDSGGDPAALEPEIENGKRFRAALLDDDGIWNIHPVDLVAFAQESNAFRLDMPKDGYPVFLRDPEAIEGIAQQMATVEETTFAIEGAEFHLSRYRIRADGVYLHQVGADLVEKRYRRLRVFCEA